MKGVVVFARKKPAVFGLEELVEVTQVSQWL